MLILILGHNGWIGSQFCSYMISNKISFLTTDIRADDYTKLFEFIKNNNVTHVLSLIGRTHGHIDGKYIPTIDYLEYPGKLKENINDNLYAPIVLSKICQDLNIHLTYLGTGCIFKYDEIHQFETSDNGFTEESQPNFFGSSYSIVKGFTDKLMHLFEKNSLNLRIRMPISSQVNQRNFITKIAKYEKVCSIKNSMTVIEDFIPIIFDMMKKSITGTFNLTNPGLISHNEILTLYQEIVDQSFKWENFSKEEQAKILKADRSNNYLSTEKIQKLYPELPDIVTSVKKTLIKMKESLNQA